MSLSDSRKRPHISTLNISNSVIRRRLTAAFWITPVIATVALPTHGQTSPSSTPTTPPAQTLFNESLTRNNLCGAAPVEMHWLLSVDGTAPAPQSLIVNGPNSGLAPAIANGSPGAAVEVVFGLDNSINWRTGGDLNQGAITPCPAADFDSGIVTPAILDSLNVSHAVEIQYFILATPDGAQFIVHSLS